MSFIDVGDHVNHEKALKEIRDLVGGTDSNMIRHAARELQLLGEEPTVVLGYLKMIQIFADMGHSGGSASVFIPTFNRLLEQRNLMPLTDDPEEWMHHTAETWGEPGGVWQNVRNGEAFSDDGGKTYTLLSEEAPVKDGHKPIHISHDHTKPFTYGEDNELSEPLTSGSTEESDIFGVEEPDISGAVSAVEELCNAIRLTVEYVGVDTLQPIDGWSWFDALKKYAPDMAQAFLDSPYSNVDVMYVEPSDGKYVKIITERGNFEDNEPIFIFRGRDMFTPQVLKFYAMLCKDEGATAEHIAAIKKHRKNIEAWQLENGSKMPD